MVQGKWMRRSMWAAGVLAMLWVVTWLAVPPLVRWLAPSRLSAALGRDVTLGAVDFHPWSLEIVLHDLVVGPAPGASAPPLLRVARIRANAALSSIVRRAPVIEAIDIDQARIALARSAPGHYDIDDLIRRFTPKPDAAPSEPARFALYNLQVHDLGVRFDDRPAGHVHVVEALNLSLPFLSNLPANVDVTVQPHLAFRLHGATFDSAALATPFAATDRATLKLSLADLDVRPYLGYVPESLPVRVASGALSADVSLAFLQPPKGDPSVTLKGWVAARDFALVNATGTPLLAWKQLRVGLADVQPLARKLAFDAVRLDGLKWHLDRDADGSVDVLRTGPLAHATAPASASVPAASAPGETPGAPWIVRVGALEIADSQILWNDASTRPAAALSLDALTLAAKGVQWPSTAPATFRLAANVGTQAASAALPAAPAASATAAHVVVEGSASQQQARVAITLADLSLQSLAPYIAQSVIPRVDGRLAAQGSLTWSAMTDAPALKIALASATLDDLRVQPAGAAPAARWDRLALIELQLDVAARTVAIAGVRLTRPNVQVARDAAGRIDAAHWLRESAPAPVAPVPAAPASQPAGAPWHVQVRSVTLDDGLLQFADASLHPEQHLPPSRAELRQLRLDVQDVAWFGDHPVPPARVILEARIGRPPVAGSTGAHGGELGWKGTLGASPPTANGSLRVVRFPVALVTPWVADRLPVSLLRAEASYIGHVDLKSGPSGLVVNTAGDALLGDVHLTTLVAAAPASAASAASPEELLGWQSLSLKGVKFAMKPDATPRLDVAQGELDDLFARVLVTEQGRLNLQDIGAAPPPGAAASDAALAPAPAPVPVPASAPAAARAPAAAASAPLPITINVGGIRLVNGRVDYTDHFVRPNYSAALTELNGSLGAFGSGSRDMATLQLHGRAAGTAILDITGQVNPVARPLALDIEAKATDLELAPLSPYAGKYAGYAIERGKLSMDVAYKIAADGRLEARNQVILNQLTFGDAIASPTATRLPVRLAVALLKDRNGVIDINLPISGSVNDPQFSVGGIVLKLLGNLLVKAVTSPFSLLAGGGGGDADMGVVEFHPGTAVVTDASAAALDKVAGALADRPALQVTITGSADVQAERADWQRESLETQLRAIARDDSLRSGAPSNAPSSVPAALAPATRSALLKTLYNQTRLPDKPRNVLGMAKHLPDAEMEDRLRRNVPVNDEAMRQQALARAIAVRDALVAKGISSDRVFLAAPTLHVAGAEPWTPRATLVPAMP
jgi:uncharacterized protein involved in outer membrane biogenesis